MDIGERDHHLYESDVVKYYSWITYVSCLKQFNNDQHNNNKLVDCNFHRIVHLFVHIIITIKHLMQ